MRSGPKEKGKGTRKAAKENVIRNLSPFLRQGGRKSRIKKGKVYQRSSQGQKLHAHPLQNLKGIKEKWKILVTLMGGGQEKTPRHLPGCAEHGGADSKGPCSGKNRSERPLLPDVVCGWGKERGRKGAARKEN